jgi:hypothetical protein
MEQTAGGRPGRQFRRDMYYKNIAVSRMAAPDIQVS